MQKFLILTPGLPRLSLASCSHKPVSAAHSSPHRESRSTEAMLSRTRRRLERLHDVKPTFCLGGSLW